MTGEQKQIVAELRKRGTSNGAAGIHLGICDEAADLIERMAAELEQVKRERDAMVRDLDIYGGCNVCKYRPHIDDACEQCTRGTPKWEWRGVCKENGVKNKP